MKRFLLTTLIVCSTVTPVLAQGFTMQNGLPPTSMDSFVHEAAGNADLIYGDEGVVDIPPYDSFTPIHRINTGITGVRNEGITTGHGSYLPDAWGADEFIGNEWSQSGANNGVPVNSGQVTTAPVVQAPQADAPTPPSTITSQTPHPRHFQQGPGQFGNTGVTLSGANNDPNAPGAGGL